MRDAAGKLASAIQAVGLDRWPGFVADAAERARDPATQAAIARGRQPPDPARDGIRPVYPVETALGIAAAGVAGGAVAAVRAAGGAFPGKILSPSAASQPDVATASADSVRDKLTRYLLNPEHIRGAAKAQWFKNALGFTRANSEQLAKQLVLDERTAVRTGENQFGTKFNQTITVVGTNGRSLPVITGWIRGEDGVARLVTALPGK